MEIFSFPQNSFLKKKNKKKKTNKKNAMVRKNNNLTCSSQLPSYCGYTILGPFSKSQVCFSCFVFVFVFQLYI